MVSEDSLKELKALLEKTKEELERKLLFLGWLSKELERQGLPTPIVVGGTSVEVYTGGVYSSGDIDLVYPFREHIRETLLSTGLFRQEGRLFISDELEIFLEIPGDKLWGDENRVLTLELGGDLKVRVIGIEDIIIDRLCACQHWDSRMDCELAELLLERYREELDWEYLKGRAAEEGVEEILKGGKGGRYG